MNDFTATLKVDRTPGDVLAALTSTKALAAWWSRVTGSGEPGGELAFVFEGPVGPTVLRVDQATTELVRWTCLSSGNMPDWAGTEVTFTIEPVGTGTAIFFRHEGLTPALECFADCYLGWSHFMQSLSRYLETGVGMPFSSQADIERRASRERARALAG
jgi:uncharacterized protein YndB with AHSA1/START domain